MNKSTINFDQKSSLAKLLATENLQVQHDNVKTASFNLEDRILTIPVFKKPEGAVYDMLIAHEVAHALHTPTKEWQTSVVVNKELRDYINVLEDCRIDKIIKKQYPGVIQDYKDGFKILWSDNFFGCNDKDLDTELMLIDKINLFYKSSETLPFDLNNVEKLWFNEVEKVVTFDDVVELAKKIADFQKKENEKLQKLPDFDSHPLTLMYGEKEEKDEEEKNDNQSSNSQPQSSEQSNEEQTESGEDTQNKPEQSENSEEKNGEGNDKSDDKKEDDKSGDLEKVTGNPDGAGADKKINMPLKSITTEKAEENTQKDYVNTEHRGYSYMNLPEANLDDIIVSPKKWLKENIKNANQYKSTYVDNMARFKTFHRDSKKTIQYLVKEFEMKKSADGYKRMTTDKTGIIDPLKLKDYKFSEDIFKRMSVIPDAKNHGMILLLDWSGSMANVIDKTTEQLCQLVWFVKQINIPFKVYFFSDKIDFSDEQVYGRDRWSTMRERRKLMKSFKYKAGDAHFDDFNLVEVANHTMKKGELEQSLMFLWSYSKYYNDGRRWTRDGEYIEYLYPPSAFHLCSTPLNEALATMYRIIPVFKQKYQVDKMSLITLTDGHSNNDNKSTYKTCEEGLGIKRDGYGKKALLKIGTKYIQSKGNTTSLLLQGLKKKFNITTIGFFIVKTRRSWEFERYLGVDHIKDYSLREQKIMTLKKEFSKNKSCSTMQEGYNEFYLINGKDMSVQNANLNELKEDAKKGDIKRVFTKSMKSRTVSRVLLSKFIRQVA